MVSRDAARLRPSRSKAPGGVCASGGAATSAAASGGGTVVAREVGAEPRPPAGPPPEEEGASAQRMVVMDRRVGRAGAAGGRRASERIDRWREQRWGQGGENEILKRRATDGLSIHTHLFPFSAAAA